MSNGSHVLVCDGALVKVVAAQTLCQNVGIFSVLVQNYSTNAVLSCGAMFPRVANMIPSSPCVPLCRPTTMKNDGTKIRAKSATLHYIGIVSIIVPSSGGRLFYL